MEQTGHFFTTIYGRNLVSELKNFVHRPYLVVTMEDLWPIFQNEFDGNLAGVLLVKTLDADELAVLISELPSCGCVIGLGGGQALDVAKLVAWTRRVPLFQVPTAMTVNAAFGHRAGIRTGGNVKYIGYAVPEAVYIDFDVIQAAPPALNRSGVCDILCYHTALADWKLAHEHGKTETQWPYSAELAAESQAVLDKVMQHLDDIRDVNETGIRVLMNAHRWGGAAFHNAGWNPRHIEGFDHFLFYSLENVTGKKFIHGQPVCLGIYVGSYLQDNKAEKMLRAIHGVGVDIRPEAMGVTWADIDRALKQLPDYVKKAGLWYTTASSFTYSPAIIEHVRGQIEALYGPWDG